LDELEWVIPYKSTVVYNALRGGERALTQLDVRPNVHPNAVHKVTKGIIKGPQAEAETTRWEENLKYNFRQASRRRSNLSGSLVWNALVYDEIVGQLIHLPTQIESLGALEANTMRQQAALRNGDFAIKLVDPKTVHGRFSQYQLEEVVEITIQTARQVVDFRAAGC
jgi:hypothetical protein